MTIQHGYCKNPLSCAASRASLPPVPRRHWRSLNETSIAQLSQTPSALETETESKTQTQNPDPAVCFGSTQDPRRFAQLRLAQTPRISVK